MRITKDLMYKFQNKTIRQEQIFEEVLHSIYTFLFSDYPSLKLM